MKTPYGTSIFCDDIRDEISGKKTYVGVYLQDMIVLGKFPVVIPQFALAITFLEPLEWEPKPAIIKVFVPGEQQYQVALELELPLNRRDSIRKDEIDPLAEYYANLLHFRVIPFAVPHEGYVKVRAYIGKEEYRLGSLHIRNPREDENLGRQ